jgi:hypothetical protein
VPARPGRPAAQADPIFALVLVVAVALQIVLAWAAESTHWVGPFHALLAFVILGLSILLAQFAWRRRPASTTA